MHDCSGGDGEWDYALLLYLEFVMLVCMSAQQIFSALHIVRKFCLRQVCAKLLQHLRCGFYCHSKVLDGLGQEK